MSKVSLESIIAIPEEGMELRIDPRVPVIRVITALASSGLVLTTSSDGQSFTVKSREHFATDGYADVGVTATIEPDPLPRAVFFPRGFGL